MKESMDERQEKTRRCVCRLGAQEHRTQAGTCELRSETWGREMLSGDHVELTAPYRVCQVRAMNTKWFRQRLKELELSQRGLAKLLDLDAAAVSYMLRGQRRMTSSGSSPEQLGQTLRTKHNIRGCESRNATL